jgi:hypothetical protein
MIRRFASFRFVPKITTVGAILHTFKFVGDCHQGPTFSCADKGSGAKSGGEAVSVVKNVIV